MFNKGQARPGSGDPVNAVVDLKAAVLLSYVGVLKIQADLGNIHILVVAGIDKADALSILIKDFRVGEHTEIIPFHLSQGIISHLPTSLQMGLYFHKDNSSRNKTEDEGHSDGLKQSLQKPSDGA